MNIEVIAAKLDGFESRSNERHTQTQNRLDQQDDTLSDILKQAKETNGRVSKLESFQTWLPILGVAVLSTAGIVWTLLTVVLGFKR